jgi:hypothetical protein
MQVMLRDDAAALVELLLETLPTQVLRIVSSGPPSGMTEGEITRLLERGIPRLDNTVELQGRIRAILNWLMLHGDIDSAGNHRFVCVPPYAIYDLDAQGTTTARLSGDDRLDDAIQRDVSLLGCAFRNEIIISELGDLEATTPFPKGIKRTIYAPAHAAQSLLDNLSNLGINHKSVSELGNYLPSIDGLMMLPKQAYDTIAPAWGIWFSYDTFAAQGQRWKKIASWHAAEPGLLRWVQSIDRRGYFFSRYFWHNRQEKLAELSRSFAMLWTYRLDNDTGRSTNIWIEGQELWLPLEIPAAHQQWLNLLSERVERIHPFTHYVLNSPATAISNRLHETLGVLIKAQRPTHR